MKSIGLAASIAGLVGAMGGTAAGAATATYQSQTVSGTLGFDTNVRLPQFDPFLGTLNSVTLGVFNQNVSLFQIENLSSQPFGTNQYDIRSLVTVELFGTLYSSLRNANFITPFLTLSSYDGTQDYDGTSGQTVFGVASVTTDLGFGTAGFIGTGSIYPTLYTSGTPQGLRYYDRGALAEIATTQVTTYATVTYDYTSPTPPPPPPVGGVPEPASWALLVAGFGIVGGVARRRRMAVVAA